MRLCRRRWALGWLLAICLAWPHVDAQPVTATDAQVRAAYLHKFPGFVAWPAQAFSGPDAPIVIAVMGEDEVSSELARLVPGRAVLGRPVEVLQLSPSAVIPPGIHVLYVGAAALRSGALGLEAQGRQGVLTVSDGDVGGTAGAALSFVEADGRIRFDASPVAAERTGLKLSARLLAVARRVAEGAP